MSRTNSRLVAVVRSLTLLAMSILFFSLTGVASAATMVSGIITEDTTWTVANSPYVITNTLTIPEGRTLSIDPGVIVKLDGIFFVYVYGSLVAEGTNENPITITSIKDDTVAGDTNGDGVATTPTPGDWLSFYFVGSAEGSFVHTIMRYGGQSNIPGYPMGQIWTQSGTVSISHSSLAQALNENIFTTGGTTTVTETTLANARHGLFVQGGHLSSTENIFASNLRPFTISGGTLELSANDFGIDGAPSIIGGEGTVINAGNNEGGKGFAIQGVITGNARWVKDSQPYIITNTLTIPEGTTLTIDPGVVVKMDGFFFVYVYGTLTAEGTHENPITITSIKDDTVAGDTNGDGNATAPAPGDWLALYFINDAHGSFVHTDIRYGGQWNGPTMPVGQILNQSGIVSVAESTLSFGLNYNIRTTGGTTTVTDSYITRAREGVHSDGGALTIHSSSITGNTDAGITNTSDEIVNATGNWWGAPTGPTALLNPGGWGDRVSSGVAYTPWRTVPPGEVEPPSCVVDCNSNILFLPGLEASRLYEQEGIIDCSILPPNSTPQAECLHEEQLWLPLTDGDTEKLYLNPYGTSTRPGIYTRETIDEVGGLPVGPNIYKTFLLDLKKWKDTDHIITDYSVVPYDWRLSVDDVLTKGVKTGENISYGSTEGTYVLDELLRMASTSRTKKVTLIAHSNGGLVAKRLMLTLRALGKEDLVDKVILVAVPQIGTPKAVGGLLHGTDLSLRVILDTVHARTLGENMPSAYALLPSQKYFTTIDIRSIPTELITFSNSTLYTKERAKYGGFVTNADELNGYLLGSEGRDEPANSDLNSPNALKPGLIDQATTLHEAIDDWYPAGTTQVIQIAGWGEYTISGVSYYTEQKQDCVTVSDPYFFGGSHQECGPQYEVKKYKPQRTFEGDGTVVVPSALWMSTTTPHVERYWVDLMAYNKDNRIVTAFGLLPFDHKNILEVDKLVDFIKRKITDSTSTLPTYITNSTSTLSGTADVNYIYTLHSPLSLDLYDEFGNHTGVSTTTGKVEENIPGSRYGTFGEVKYIFASADRAQYLRLKGYATGTFSLGIEQIQGDSSLASTTFASIPVSTSTIATFSLPVNGALSPSTPLSVDEDGNGTIDLILAPQFGATVYPDLTMPSTTVLTTGTLGTNGWYRSNILITLTATDTGSGVASTTFSLNSGATWNNYTTPFTVSTEGTSTILYRSTDKAGNREATSSLSLKIDKTAPEARISVSTTTQDLLIEGIDNLTTTTVLKDQSGNHVITDQAGHTTKLYFIKTYSGKILTYAKLTGVQYDKEAKITLPSSSFLYVWDTKTPASPISQTIAVDGTYLLQASYDKKANKTVIIVLKKNLPIQSQTFMAIKIVKLITNKGVLGYAY